MTHIISLQKLSSASVYAVFILAPLDPGGIVIARGMN